MLRGIVVVCALAGVLGLLAANASTAGAVAASAAPTVAPTQDPYAAALFKHAQAVWRDRTDVPYLRYGALVRYLHSGHVFDNWWDAYARTSDGRIALMRLLDVNEERRRLSGVVFSIFGLTIFDTNPDAEPIRLEEPTIEPNATFGIYSKYGGSRVRSFDAPANPDPTPSPSPESSPSSGDELRTIGTVEATVADYRITYAGPQTLRDGPASHLVLVPLRDPSANRLRDLWIDPVTYRTMQLRVAGILNGEPYDRVSWIATYVLVDGRNYLQQLVPESPLRFGFDTVIPKFEIDFVDYHFPATVPPYTFDKPFSL